MAIYFGQDIATKLTQADAFFGVNSHIRTYDWAEYTDDEQKAALVQAERELDGHIGMSLEESYSETSFPIVEHSSYRPDYAVFEQALFLLDNTARSRGASGGVKAIESEEYQREERTTGVTIAPAASMYLRLARIQMERG